MHYKSGREAKLGDRCEFVTDTGAKRQGIIVVFVAGPHTTCNAGVMFTSWSPAGYWYNDFAYVTLPECEYVE